METILTLDWESLDNPTYIGLLVAVLMFLVFRPTIELLFERHWRKTHPGEPFPEVWSERGLAINVVTFVLAFLIAMFRLGFDWGPVIVAAVASSVVACTSYELVKNILRPAGIDIGTFRSFG